MLRTIPLLLPFTLAAFFALFGSALFPAVKLLAFSPFLAILYHRTSFIASLWIASLCGLIIDLCSSELRIGVHALNYSLATLLLYRQKQHFFEDKIVALSLFTIVISFVSSLIQLFLLSIFGRMLPLSLKLIGADLIAMPLADGIYAFLWFSCPILICRHLARIHWKNKAAQAMRFFRELWPQKQK